METLREFFLNQVLSLAVLAAVVYFLRDRIASWIDAKTRHRFDKKLEELKADLSAKGREIDALRAAPLSARAARQAMIDKRRLEAADQLWSATKSLQQYKALAGTIGILKWDASIAAAQSDEKFREAAKIFAFGADTKAFGKHDAYNARPYVTPLAWSLFSAYQSTLGFCVMRMVALQTGVFKDALPDDGKVIEMLKEALPHWRDYLQKTRMGAVTYALDELENQLVSELKRTMDGEDDDASAIEHARKINDRVKEVQEATEAAQAKSKGAPTVS